MNFFIFKDKALSKGIYCNGGKISDLTLDKIPLTDEVLFVLPNEIIQYIYFEHELKNKKNIHASILNNQSTTRIDASKLEVIDTQKNIQDFFIIEENVRNRLKQTFSQFNRKISLTSDLLFFKEAFQANVKFEENIYLQQDDNFVKLSEQAYTLLDQSNQIKKITKNDFSKLKIKDFNFFEFNSFDIKSIFNIQNVRTPAIVGSVILLLIYAVGLFNINSNYVQIRSMETSLVNMYGEIYENENINNIESHIQNKLTQLNQLNESKVKKAANLIQLISQNTDILEAKFNRDKLIIKCRFNNDAEESIFINQQNRLNNNFLITETQTNQLGRITTIEYEI